MVLMMLFSWAMFTAILAKFPIFPASATMLMAMLILCTMDGGSIYETMYELITPLNFSPVFQRVFRLKKPYSMNIF